MVLTLIQQGLGLRPRSREPCAGIWGLGDTSTMNAPSERKQSFWAINLRQFFFMFRRRIFLSYAFPIM